MDINLKKNDISELSITSMTSDGIGVGKLNGLAVFVSNCAVGDHLLVRILKSKKKYAYGKIEKILIPSEDRIEPTCSAYPKCGGCAYRHIKYSSELKIKEQRVRDSLIHIGGFKEPLVEHIIPSERIDGYRNKIIMPVRENDGTVLMGFFANGSHRVINCENCSLQHPKLSGICTTIKAWIEKTNQTIYNETTKKGNIRNIYARIADGTQNIMVCIVASKDKLFCEDKLIYMLTSSIPNITSIVINKNNKDTNVVLGDSFRVIFGDDHITDILCNLKFNLSARSFYQVNHDQAEKLYTIAKDFACINKNDTVLDLYCGTGTIGLTMASSAKKIIGVDIVEQSIKDAKSNAKLNNIDNAEFICSDASGASLMLLDRKESVDTVIIDPPRKGCDENLINTIDEISPKRIVYISCDPATLSRDLKIFNQKGYIFKKIQPVDMFPRTSHVETVVLLVREKHVL